MPLSILAAFLSLGRKYEIDHVRQQAVQRLTAAFPSHVDQFYELKAQLLTSIVGLSIKNGDYLRLVNIIRENDLLVHLPLALLKCVAKDHNTASSIFLPSPRTQQPILPYKDIELCHNAHTKLMKLQRTELFMWAQDAPRNPACNIASCQEHRYRFFFQHFSENFYVGVEWKDKWDAAFCEKCWLRGRSTYRVGQAKIHEMLPSLFDLPPWGELREKWSKVCLLLPLKNTFI